MDSITCNFCNESFKNKNVLSQHQKKTKYCLEIQGKQNEKFRCEFCDKTLVTNVRLNTHIQTCKMKIKKESEEKENNIKNTYKKEIKEMQKINKDTIKLYEKKLDEKDVHYTSILDTKEKETQRLLDEKEKQIAKLEEIIKNKDKSIMDIAFSKTARTLPITNNTNITVNNHYTINLHDIDRLNQVIERHMTQSVIRGGIPSFTRMLYKNYLTSPEGELGYKCTDIARQKFELIDENGNRREDVRADELREALEKSNLEEKTKRTAKEAWTKADGTCNKDIFNQLVVKAQEITAITEQAGDCNAKFRSELAVQTSKYIK